MGRGFAFRLLAATGGGSPEANCRCWRPPSSPSDVPRMSQSFRAFGVLDLPGRFQTVQNNKKNQMERPDRRARLARVNYLSDQNSTHENRLANGNIVVGTGRGHNHAILSAICNHFCPRRERTGRLKLQNFFTVTSPAS